MTEFIEFTRVHILDLPHDLLLNCLARVSRLYYPTLCLVSKRFRSPITSLELYQTRALLGHTESCLYLCLRFRRSEQEVYGKLEWCEVVLKVPKSCCLLEFLAVDV
ncbi:hypothetical protein F2Q69_00049524 [Brassica cretica]|uniref:F-box domain-containing protein n=1 Tax=Brassica cretica TaxID=69181 RepID=A0A8S9PQ85_BRACR|nr:hypothetical protein F2Q69_00049524 [Brassica cretica]